MRWQGRIHPTGKHQDALGNGTFRTIAPQSAVRTVKGSGIEMGPDQPEPHGIPKSTNIE
jgi:hypothetical protein